MDGLQWVLELVLVVLLVATLFHALRLERALGVLKRDRGALEALVAGFNASTRQAEAGIERLHDAAEGAGRQIARQAELASQLKDDLVFLMERGDRTADRLDALVRTTRASVGEARPPEPRAPDPRFAEAEVTEAPRVRSQAERDLLKALRMAR